ncbi:MAG: hypothetical protein CMP28_10570 [Roseibacillus sp.]|nr:hypothetical protein [Roseibacillus sp.]
MTKRWILVLYLVPAMILAGGSLPFLFSDLDMEIAQKYYNGKARLWTLAEKSPWTLFYSFGPIPAIITGVIAFSVLFLGLSRARFTPYRKLSAFLALALIVGPGLMVNLVLKETCERPRPREVQGLGGSEQFERILARGPDTTGHSFVNGHASMGFYFFAGGLALFACGRRKTGILVLIAAGLLGYFTGKSRIVQGEHFASDVLWAAGLVWFTSAILFHLFGLHRKAIYETSKPVGASTPAWIPFASLIIILTAIGSTCLAFPSARINTTELVSEELTRLPDTVRITLDLEGSLEFSGGEELLLETEARGIGFPRSRLLSQRTLVQDGSEITHRRNGYFTKLNVRNKITLPPNRVYQITLGKRVASVLVHPPSKTSRAGHFAHIELTSRPETELINIKSPPIDEDFFGRRTRAFRVE